VTLSVPKDASGPARSCSSAVFRSASRWPLWPFVMNSAEEIHQAMVDFQAGRLGAIER
jgi:hypothetical protein